MRERAAREDYDNTQNVSQTKKEKNGGAGD